jgi:DNA-binding transcriptional ArsR family regulator
MRSLGFLSNHGRVLLLLARDPGMRLRDIAARLDITERSAYGIITDLTAAGYISKRKDGRRNRYQIEAHQPLPEPASRERTVGEVLAMLTGTGQPAADGDTADPARAAVRMHPGAARHQADRSSST